MNETVPDTNTIARNIDAVRIDGERLWGALMELAQIGATPKGGVCRLTLTDLDKQGRDLVLSWAREAGMTVTIDKIGNAFMRRAGRDNALPPIVTGSHIDTQPTGGKFDGNYGVLAGIEVVRTLNDHGIETEAPIEVAFWTNEEGSRFVPVMMGSGVFAKAAVVVLMTFFPMLVSTLAGLQASQRLERELMHSYAAGYLRTLWSLRLPSAVPFMFAALKVNASLALIGAIVAEFFGSPTTGLGFRISTEALKMNMTLVWAAVVVAAVTGSR